MSHATQRDYAESGMTLQSVMLDHWKRYPDKSKRPADILWHGLHIQTSDVFAVPSHGMVSAEFLSVVGDVEQGFDIEVDGWLELSDGDHIPHLRTWKDERYEDFVEYPFFCSDGRLFVWNVYKMKYPSGEIVEEKWTENAGFWIERVSETERIYHCSHGMATPPDFECLVFRVRIST